MKGEILKLLKETDGYISGQELCERFGVSRTAVWKVINQLKEEGYEIEAVRNRGYTLKSVSDVLSREEILSSISTVWAGRHVKYLEKTAGQADLDSIYVVLDMKPVVGSIEDQVRGIRHSLSMQHHFDGSRLRR